MEEEKEKTRKLLESSREELDRRMEVRVRNAEQRETELKNEYKTYSLSRYGCYVLPKTTVDAKYEIIGYSLEHLNAYSYELLRPAIYDVTLNYKGLRDADSFEMMDLILASRVYDYSTCIESVSAFKIVPGKMYRSIIAGKGKDIASWYATNFDASKKVLDDLVETLSK